MTPYPESVKAEARRLHSAGVSYTEIARQLDVKGGRDTVRLWCDPAAAARCRQRQRTLPAFLCASCGRRCIPGKDGVGVRATRFCNRECSNADSPRALNKDKAHRYSDAIRSEARHLSGLGWSYQRIARRLGTTASTVARWCDDDAARRQRESKARAYAKPEAKRAKATRARQRRREASAALRARERDRFARRAQADPAGRAYALLRQAAALLQQEVDAAIDPVRRLAAGRALSETHQAEDAAADLVRMAAGPEPKAEAS